MILRLFLSLLAFIGITCSAQAAEDKPISYNRDIRPILSDKCFFCHGPDNQHRKAQLRLDKPDDGEGYDGAHLAAAVPGEPDLSELVSRIYSQKPKLVMPPAASKKTLTDAEKALLVRWIKDGAKYESHWAFTKPQKPELPAVSDPKWVHNPIDSFVFARLEAEGLKPSPAASKAHLIRRLTLDLIGLPPTTQEVDAFLADDSADAYERLVDRLLASPHFGERMAVPWLDAARYADTNGFSIDDHRDMWLWREWVIDAYNRNVPYDQFVIQQLAGDLLPGATDQSRLPTGFLRNSMNTHEGGTIPEEYRVIYIADKIDTVSTVFMGLTMRCAQCHDHKYDSLSQKEYYSLFAFFDRADERGKGETNANTPPVIRMDGPITDNATWKADVEHRIATLQRYLLHPPEMVVPRAKWEAQAIASAEEPLLESLKVPAMERTDEQWGVINEAFSKTTELWDRHINVIKTEIKILEQELKAGKPSVMVMQEKGPAKTFVLTRGAYDQPDMNQPVTAGVPAVFPSLPDRVGAAPTRLELARWLVGPDHPLTARVAVNRTWQMFFGSGLVTTLNDFGMQGSYPSHPELLDYLATRYIDSGWDTKKLVKLIVMSSTYQQSSEVSDELLERDRDNTLLARMTRFRLPAEFIRDNALAISGQLDPRIAGPSVYPAQPFGLWREVSHFGYEKPFTAQAFYPSEGSSLHRRSMYTFWKRTSPPPSLSAFDAPSREVCTVLRSRTNTPLQALVLLNDPEYVDAAKSLARLAIREAGKSRMQRLDYMFKRATARFLEPREREVLLVHHHNAMTKFMNDPEAAVKLVGENSPELAAWTSVAAVILNLDETITRE